VNKVYKQLKKYFLIGAKELIYGGHLSAIEDASLIVIAISLTSLPLNIIPIAIIYLAAQVVYTYNHFSEIAADSTSNPERTKYIKKDRTKKILAIYIVLLLFFVALTNIATILLVLIITLAGISYTVFLKEVLTKRIIGFKNVYTTSLLTSSIFIVPTFYGVQFNSTLVYLFCIAFMRMFVNTSFCDIKDIVSDKQFGLKTLPVVFGKKRTIYILNLISFISLIPLIFGVYNDSLPTEALFLGAAYFYRLYYLIKGSSVGEIELRRLAYIMVDSEYIFWLIVLVIGRGTLQIL